MAYKKRLKIAIDLLTQTANIYKDDQMIYNDLMQQIQMFNDFVKDKEFIEQDVAIQDAQALCILNTAINKVSALIDEARQQVIL